MHVILSMEYARKRSKAFHPKTREAGTEMPTPMGASAHLGYHASKSPLSPPVCRLRSLRTTTIQVCGQRSLLEAGSLSFHPASMPFWLVCQSPCVRTFYLVVAYESL